MPVRRWSPPRIRLPDDLIEAEIFTRLPAKSVLRFRLISKACNNMSRSTFFARQHLLHHQHLHRSLLIYHDPRGRNTESTLSMLEIDDTEKVIKLSTNLGCLSPFKLTIFGSCNGLLCLRDYDWSPNVYVCNPLINEFLRLPSIARKDDGEDRHICCGLGYDNINSEFKVVSMMPRLKKDENGRTHWAAMAVEVLTIKTTRCQEKWRSLEDIPYLLCSYDVAYVDGKLHWSCCPFQRPIKQFSILSFDPTKEEFRTMPAPSSMNKEPSGQCVIEEFEGLLSLVWLNFMERGCHLCEVEVEVWVMKEYGRSESWIKEHDIKTKLHVGPTKALSISSTFHQWKKDEILMGYGHRLISFDMRSKVVRDCSSDIKRCFGDFSPHAVVGHVGSLISLKKAGAKVMKNPKKS